MKKINVLLICGLLLLGSAANAQFRSIPGVVTDSFKVRYPSATNVKWEDKISAFQATFLLDKATFIARYNSDGIWQSAQTKIKKEELPGAVNDGLSKSKYADWKMGTVTKIILPGEVIQYKIFVSKGDLNAKNLLFGSDGQLLKDNITL